MIKDRILSQAQRLKGLHNFYYSNVSLKLVDTNSQNSFQMKPAFLGPPLQKLRWQPLLSLTNTFFKETNAWDLSDGHFAQANHFSNLNSVAAATTVSFIFCFGDRKKMRQTLCSIFHSILHKNPTRTILCSCFQSQMGQRVETGVK